MQKVKFNLKLILKLNFNFIETIYYKNQNIDLILKDQNIIQFDDPFFPPNITSLIPQDKTDPSFQKTPKNYRDEYQTYIWLRFSEIFPDKNYKIFFPDLDQEGINQGSLGSCY